ncbi:hypothetical protein ABEB36_000560 [Hypothenemus hampei]
MVNQQDEYTCNVTIHDSIEILIPSNEPHSIIITSSTLISDIFTEVSKYIATPVEDIELIFKANGAVLGELSQYKEATLNDTGLCPMESNSHYELVVTLFNKNNVDAMGVETWKEDELLLGASASPTAEAMPISSISSFEDYPTTTSTDRNSPGMLQYNQTRRWATALPSPVVNESSSYVGLVNQAMTCYLNSLLQALYMTPEFRNALYNWEFDGKNEAISIPYQLQKLFLNLQTSTKSAVETTDLTTSFGWQGSDAWHQHDIQELCRVMFDALERTFKDTKQANLINDLYEGKMLDYVKCLECGTEKSREDTFLDIPLPVRPFGSTVAYNSVEEALRAFVQPETLDGNNQYFCEKCNKKCDAHKGLKFTKFPYLLTLHLKRFDFDYNTMHRIKLNDKVVFPEVLNLNSFVPQCNGHKTEYVAVPGAGEGGRESATKCDDCSTTDSGSADDESCQGTDLSSTVNGHDDNCADSDEGIDVSSGTNLQENEPKGPYTYELFSIMIHSGSASGGHYYAYIKDFDKNLWFCFNDQSVTSVTHDDIRKTYGGGPHRAYYSGAYTSSTNAYMLMYRQIDKERNCPAMTVTEFPPHLQMLLNNLKYKDEQDRLNRKKQDQMVKINVVCLHPHSNFLLGLNISAFCDSTLAELAQLAYKRFKLEGVVDLQDCRMVSYNKQYECVDYSFESDEITFTFGLKNVPMFLDWMLEIREPGTEWKHYQMGGINVRVYPINLENEDIEEPVVVRLDIGETIGQLKNELGHLLKVEPESLKIIQANYGCEPNFFHDDTEIVHLPDDKCPEYKYYVSNACHNNPDTANANMQKLKKLIEIYSGIITLHVALPDTTEGTLELLSIPSLDLNQNVDQERENAVSPNLRVSPQPGASGMCGDGYDQSNSEDSSLSDSDRTLIGDAPPDCLGLSSNSASPADQHMASPADPCQDVLGVLTEEMYWDHPDSCMDVQKDGINYYFKVTSILETNSSNSQQPYRECRILADKKMTLETLKKHLEKVIRIPSAYFKVFRRNSLIDDEWTRVKDTLRCVKDGERLTLKLGRVLGENEHQCKVYHLKPNSTDGNLLLFEHIISKNQTVESVKQEILQRAKKQNLLDIPYNRCRLREKNWKMPKTVYLDDQKLGIDVQFPYNLELYLQELTEPETVTSHNQVVLFLRKFSPSELSLGPFQEIVLDLTTMDHLRTKVSEISNIPLEYLDVAQVKGNFPYDVHILEINDDLEWKMDSLEQRSLSICCGYMFFYKDRREPLKELTSEEKKEIRQKEDHRMGRRSVIGSGREQALKIYLLDSTPPSKLEDDID